MEKNKALGTYEQNSYASGAKRYGMNASSAPTTGPVSKDGYIERDAENNRKKQVYLSWMQNNSVGAYNSPGALRKPPVPGPMPPIMNKPAPNKPGMVPSPRPMPPIMNKPAFNKPGIMPPIMNKPAFNKPGIMPFPGMR